ncbi:MAG: hypothetical protein HKM05_05625 [Spirochaetales bacterium]|nr:hypothetical protein [Spirochaetales bacterium]
MLVTKARRTLLTLVAWLWEQPQTLLGSSLRLAFHGARYRWFKLDDGVSKTGPFVLRITGNWGAFSLGQTILMGLPPGYPGLEPMLRHEAGHSRQSRLLGPLYLVVIGLPSLLWAGWYTWRYRRGRTKTPHPYGWFYTEAWADLWAWQGPVPAEFTQSLVQTSGDSP